MFAIAKSFAGSGAELLNKGQYQDHYADCQFLRG